MAKGARPRSPKPDLLETAFDVIADEGLSADLAVRVAERAKVTLAEVYRAFPSQSRLMAALSQRIDEAMLEADRAELAELPPRDRVFELMMSRFEAMQRFRGGLERVARAARREPVLLLGAACRMERSLIWLQTAAGLEASGLRARLGRRALGLVYLRALQVWLDDQGLDMAKTMAELDQLLRRAEPFAGLRERRRRPEAAAPGSPPEEPPSDAIIQPA